MMKFFSILIAGIVLGITVPSIAQAQFKQPGGNKWSESVCRKNAQANGYGSGVDYCAKKAREMKAKGKTIVE